MIERIKGWFGQLRLSPWLIACLIGAIAAILPIWPSPADPSDRISMLAYALSWGGALFQVASGGALGFAFSRKVMRLDVSSVGVVTETYTTTQGDTTLTRVDWHARALAGLAQSLVIAAFAIGVAVAV